MDKEKKKLSLNVVPSQSQSKHKGFGAGAIDLSNLSAVIIDNGEAYIDAGALHAKSKVERGIKFYTSKDEVPGGRKVWVVWVAVDWTEDGGRYYAGVTACEMLIDEEAKKGYKILAEHVNLMDRALKRRFILDGLDDSERQALKKLLMEHNPQWWDNSPAELKEALK